MFAATLSHTKANVCISVTDSCHCKRGAHTSSKVAGSSLRGWCLRLGCRACDSASAARTSTFGSPLRACHYGEHGPQACPHYPVVRTAVASVSCAEQQTRRVIQAPLGPGRCPGNKFPGTNCFHVNRVIKYTTNCCLN